MSDTGNIPASMIEAGARAEYEGDMTAEESDDFEPFTWDQALTRVKGLYRERFRAGLAAALAECEVWKERGVLFGSGQFAAGPVGGVDAVAAWRLVVVTPAQEGQNGS